MHAATLYHRRSTKIHPMVSPREREVLELLSNGFVTKEIASTLFLSNHTVNDHRKALMQKLDSKNVAQMIRKGFEFNLLNASI